MLSGALAGLLLLVCAPWLLFLVNRLWRGSLAVDAAAALAASAALGLPVRPASLRARLTADGDHGGAPVRVEWRGGLGGAHCMVWGPAGRRRVPLIVDEVQLREALALVGARER